MGLMGIFQFRVFRFILINVLRLLCVTALCLVIATEIVQITHQIEGYKSRHDTPSIATTPSSNTTSIAHELERRATGMFSNVTESNTTSIPAASPVQSFSAECNYIPGTNVPKIAGGIMFAVLSRVFNVIVLCFMLVSECPPPARIVTNLYKRFFPPLSEDASVTVLGLLMVWIAASILSHDLAAFPLIASWYMFVIGILTILFGLIYGTEIRRIRSIFTTKRTPPPQISYPGKVMAQNDMNLESGLKAPPTVRTRSGKGIVTINLPKEGPEY